MRSRICSAAIGPRVFTALACALALLLTSGASQAQQGQFNPSPSMPSTRNQGGSGVLVLPNLPARQPLPENPSPAPEIAPQPGQALTVAPHELSHQQGYEQVTVTVTNQRGQYVTNLQRGDFKLYVDGQPQNIAFFRQDLNAPVSVGILVDTSGSMEPKLPQARAAIAQFINDLNARDDIFLFAFSDKAYMLQPFTINHDAVVQKLQILNAYGQTALFDAIMNGLLMLRHGRYDKKALLVITDGMDNSSAYGLEDVVGQARRRGVLIYSIGIGDPNASPPGFFGLTGSGDAVDTQTLNLLSSESGARSFLVRDVGDGLALRTDCEAISRELREQYTLGFVASDSSHSGYRNLRVDVPGRAGVEARVRKGVTVGAAGAESTAAD